VQSRRQGGRQARCDIPARDLDRCAPGDQHEHQPEGRLQCHRPAELADPATENNRRHQPDEHAAHGVRRGQDHPRARLCQRSLAGVASQVPGDAGQRGKRYRADDHHDRPDRAEVTDVDVLATEGETAEVPDRIAVEPDVHAPQRRQDADPQVLLDRSHDGQHHQGYHHPDRHRAGPESGRGRIVRGDPRRPGGPSGARGPEVRRDTGEDPDAEEEADRRGVQRDAVRPHRQRPGCRRENHCNGEPDDDAQERTGPRRWDHLTPAGGTRGHHQVERGQNQRGQEKRSPDAVLGEAKRAEQRHPSDLERHPDQHADRVGVVGFHAGLFAGRADIGRDYYQHHHHDGTEEQPRIPNRGCSQRAEDLHTGGRRKQRSRPARLLDWRRRRQRRHGANCSGIPGSGG